jgi:nitrite reductase (NO-forming)
VLVELETIEKHMPLANGMYGLILVQPEEGLPRMDQQFYVRQGDVNTEGKLGDRGFQAFSMGKLLAERPEYIVFNGAVGALMGARALHAKVGEKVRFFFGVGGPNITSGFHVIGEIFIPGASMLVDRSLSRVVKGAVGAVIVEGPEAPYVYRKLPGM